MADGRILRGIVHEVATLFPILRIALAALVAVSRSCFDLPDSLSRSVELLSHRLECRVGCHIETESFLGLLGLAIHDVRPPYRLWIALTYKLLLQR